jgi:hypothetical protein
MRKTIYLLTLNCYYQNVNVNRLGKKMISKNKNNIVIEKCFTENSINNLMNCKRSMDKIRFEISKKTKKEVEVTIEEIVSSIDLGLSNDIY